MIRHARAVLVVTCASAPLAVLACGGAGRPATPPSPRVTRPTPDAGARADVDASRETAGPTPLEALAARQEALAPGMHEVLRADMVLAGPHDVTLPTASADTCVRVAFDADEPVRASFVDGPTALADAGASRGALGADGPVCVRKGETPVLHLDGAGPVHVVVWASP